MKKTIYIFPTILLIAFACSQHKISSTLPSIEPPTEKALDYNFDLNQAKNIVHYTSKHKNARQKLANQNRTFQNDNWNRLNATNKNPDKRNTGGAFKFYKN